MTFAEVDRAIRRLGFVPSRQRGSHVSYRHPDGRGTTVPNHGSRDIAPPLLRAILRERGEGRTPLTPSTSTRPSRKLPTCTPRPPATATPRPPRPTPRPPETSNSAALAAPLQPLLSQGSNNGRGDSCVARLGLAERSHLLKLSTRDVGPPVASATKLNESFLDQAKDRAPREAIFRDGLVD
jgi:predicted RNA binding protein YcfA (HicA-like mRNA interferase family)